MLPTLLLVQVWESPVTDKPVLEPCFAAGEAGLVWEPTKLQPPGAPTTSV